MAEARDAMTDALERLRQTHFAIIPSELEPDLENPKEGPGELGLDVRLIDDRVVVTGVPDGMPASVAGVKPGWIVEKIDGKPVVEILKAAERGLREDGAAAPRTGSGPSTPGSMPASGRSIGVDFLDGKDRPVHRDLDRPGAVGRARDVRASAHHVRPLRDEADRADGGIRLAQHLLRPGQRASGSSAR